MTDLPAAKAAELRESHWRSVFKAITYRITGTITTALLVFFLTGDLEIAMAIGAIEPVVKLLIYYLHERAWQMAPRGAVRRFLAGRRARRQSAATNRRE